MYRIGGFALLTTLLGAGSAWAQADSAKTAEPAPAKAADPAPAKPLNISGFVTASYTYAAHHTGSAIVGRFYDRIHDQIEINAAKLVVEKTVATDKFDAGARADFLFGQNAVVTKSLGLDLGTNGDLIQAFATVNIPAGEGKYVQFKAGKMATLMGVEVIEDVVNPNLSVANQFVYLENFTNTGLRMDVKPAATVDFQLAVINGWDVVTDNNTKKSFMGRIGFTPSPVTTLGLIGYFGNEKPVDPLTGTTPSGDRYGAEVVLSQKVGSKATVLLQGDYGEEKNLPITGTKAKWWGAGVWLTYEVSTILAVAARGDYVDDKNGVRTSGVFGFPANTRQKFGSGTLTLNIKKWENALIRPEIRYDRSSLAVYDSPTTPKKDLFSFALGASYLF
jgi:hypothetical protein